MLNLVWIICTLIVYGFEFGAMALIIISIYKLADWLYSTGGRP